MGNMKILIGDRKKPEEVVKIDNNGMDVTVEDCFTGIGVRTEQGLFGIAQRDGGIEVLLDGKPVWSSVEDG